MTHFFSVSKMLPCGGAGQEGPPEWEVQHPFLCILTTQEGSFLCLPRNHAVCISLTFVVSSSSVQSDQCANKVHPGKTFSSPAPPGPPAGLTVLLGSCQEAQNLMTTVLLAATSVLEIRIQLNKTSVCLGCLLFGFFWFGFFVLL